MSRLRTMFSPTLVLAVLAAVMTSHDARAGSTVQNAVGACNGALPGFEGALRKRPLAIANEGASNAFVSCTLATDQVLSTGVTTAGVGIINRDTVPVAVSCTFVDGTAPEIAGAIPPTFYPKTIAILPGSAPSIVWTADEFGLTTFSEIASISCNLPPKTEIAAFVTLWGS